MIVYSYDPVTGEYLGTTTADPNPVEPGEYLMPAFTTTVQPPVPAEGHKAIWQSDVWTEVPVEFIAPQEEPLTLGQMKAIRKEQIEKDRDAQLYSTFAFTVPSTQLPVLADADQQSQANILLAAQLAQVPGAPASVLWRMADNSLASLTATDVLAMAKAMGDHIQATYQRSWERKAALAAAQTPEEIAST